MAYRQIQYARNFVHERCQTTVWILCMVKNHLYFERCVSNSPAWMHILLLLPTLELTRDKVVFPNSPAKPFFFPKIILNFFFGWCMVLFHLELWVPLSITEGFLTEQCWCYVIYLSDCFFNFSCTFLRLCLNNWVT